MLSANMGFMWNNIEPTIIFFKMKELLLVLLLVGVLATQMSNDCKPSKPDAVMTKFLADY